MNELWKRLGLFKGLTVLHFADDGDGDGSGGGAGDGDGAGDGGGGDGDGNTNIGLDGGGDTGGEAKVSSWIDEDGTLKEGWKNALLDENSRKQGIYSRVKDVKGILSILGNQEQAISKKGVIPIDENSSDEQKTAFRESMGIPETSDKYAFDVPEGMEDYYGQDLVTEAKEALHGANLSQKQYETVMALDAKRLQLMQEEAESNQLDAELTAEKEIDTLFGNNKKTAINHANLAINELTKGWEPGMREKLFGNQDEPNGINSPEFSELKPLFLKLMSDIGGYFSEDGGIQSGKLADPDTLDDQIGQLSGQLTQDLHRQDRKKYNSILEQREQLYKKRFPG